MHPAAEWFHRKCGVPTEAYLECMENYNKNRVAIATLFLAINVHFRCQMKSMLDSLFCGKARLPATVHRTVAKSHLEVNGCKASREGGLGHSSPTDIKIIDMSKHVDYFWRPLLDSNQRPAD